MGNLPKWSKAYKDMLLLQPSSAAAECQTLSDRKELALKDYIIHFQFVHHVLVKNYFKHWNIGK